ncbi:MAG: hypothetical protein ACOY3Y_01800 [Acidobacteriota bacterium]
MIPWSNQKTPNLGDAYVVVPGGTVTEIYLKMSSTVPVGKSEEIVLIHNGIEDATLRCTVSAGADSCSASGSRAVATGDTVTARIYEPQNFNMGLRFFIRFTTTP